MSELNSISGGNTCRAIPLHRSEGLPLAASRGVVGGLLALLTMLALLALLALLGTLLLGLVLATGLVAGSSRLSPAGKRALAGVSLLGASGLDAGGGRLVHGLA